MMRYILLFIFLTINLTNLHGKNVDSLINQLDLLEGKEKIELLTELCWELKYTNQQEALTYGLEGLDLARFFSTKEKESALLKNIAVVYLLKSDFEQSRKYCHQALELFQKQNNSIGIADISNILGLAYSNQGTYDLAIEEFEKSVILYNAVGDTTKVMAVEANIGNVYLGQGEFQKAIPLYERIILDARQKKDHQKLSINIFNIGIIYTKLGDYPKALNYLYEASDINKSLNNTFHWIKTQNEIGLIFRRLEMIDEAIILYQPALKKAKELDNKNLVASLSNNLGLCYFRKNQFEKALDCYNTSLEIRQSLKILNVGHILNNIGNTYKALGKDEQALDFYNQALETNIQLNLESKMALDWSNLGGLHLEQSNYIESEKCLLNAFSILEKTKQLKELVSVTELLSTLYNNLNQEEKEISFNHLHQNYSDSLYSKEKILAATRIIVREQLKEKNEQINHSKNALAQIENKNEGTQKNNQLLFGLLISLIGLSLLGIYYYRKRVNLNKQKLAKNLAIAESEKLLLQSSLEKQNKEMVLFSLEMVQNKELFKSLKIHVSTLAKKHPNNIEIKNILNKLSINEIVTKDWSYFNEVFNIAFPDFTQNIRKIYPNLSRKELQHCALIKLNISSAEAANIMGITTESVHTARYRLRKKFNLVRQESLEDAVLNF
ncbi:MAG: tetratricopeptide repeat protein [Saprospiraceae bacterium]